MTLGIKELKVPGFKWHFSQCDSPNKQILNLPQVMICPTKENFPIFIAPPKKTVFYLSFCVCQLRCL